MATINTPIIKQGNSTTQQISHSSSTNIHRLHNWVFLTEAGKTTNTEFVSFDNVTIKITDDGTNRFLTVYLAGHNLIKGSIFNLTSVNPTINSTYFDNNPTFTVTTVINTAVVQVNLGNVLLNLGSFTASINYTRTVSYTSADIGKRCRVVENNTFYDLVSFDVSNAPVWVNAHGASTLQSEGDLIASALTKSTPVDTDQIGLMDSSASNVLKKLSWTNIKANLKSYFDSVYQTVLVSGSSIKTINNTSILGSGDITISSGTANSSGYTTTVNELSSLITTIPTSTISAELTETFLLSEPFSNQITTYTYSTVGAYGGCYIYNNTTVIATIKTTTNSDTSGGFILKSADAGASFNSIRNTIRPNLLACAYPKILCTTRANTNDDTLTYSIDGGTTFSTWTPSGGIFTSIAVSPNGSTWVATFKNTSTATITFYIITNNGATRTPINTAYVGTVPFISINDSGEFLFFNADSLTIIKYIPSSFYTILQLFGNSNEIATGISSVCCDTNFNYIYFTDYNHSLFRSDNKGVSFTKIYTNSSNIPDGLVCSNDGSNVYMLPSNTSYGIISSDYGNSFTSLAYHTYYRPIVYLSSSSKYALFASTAYNTGQLGTYTLNNTKRVPLSDLYTGISQSLPASLSGFTNSTYFNNCIGQLVQSTNAGTYNTSLGSSCLSNNSAGSYNVAIGYAALFSNTTGRDNIAMGHHALYYNTTSYENIAMGTQALYYNTTGYRNIAMGTQALFSNTTGYDNVAIGANALVSNTPGGNNVCLGVNSGNDTLKTITSENNHVILGNFYTTNALIKVAWTIGSDGRDKTNITPLVLGLDFVNQLKPSKFNYTIDRESKAIAEGSRLRYGFIAQDILELEKEPVIVNDSNPDFLALNETALIPVLVNAIKELTARIELLEAKIK